MEQTRETVVSISMVKLNIWVLITTLGVFFGVMVSHSLFFGRFALTFTLFGMTLFLSALIVFICIHEAIHLIGFRYIGGVSRQELVWGVNWKMGVAYAHAKKPITVKQMKKVLMLPLIPTGLLPLVIGVSINFPALSILGVIMAAGCLGDLALYRKLVKFPEYALVQDHPSKPQFIVYE
ncbi:Putative zincin peptidase [Lentibacillus halodurans]|uniref:Putative zincin peptidase n=1 Tax=Lentibacillus halodurans TaxID=237679 RepID=A0A1I0X5C5_9BACI|nr:DUF3267 domain-containing protein [Lentibacillus halodurans]SFA95580.1 Putative zincin peptidase [Lentibacillus halodurans]